MNQELIKPQLLEAVLTPEQCQAVIDLATVQGMQVDFRPTSSHPLRQGAVLTEPLDELQELTNLAEQLMPDCVAEPVEVVRYQTGYQYPVHYDGKTRKRTLVLYLNDDYQGGHTCFPRRDTLLFKPPAGSVLTWANTDSDGVQIYNNAHQVNRVTDGDKWVAVLWLG